ncbi:outer membrane protein assembly factor BamB family protein [Natronolimnohabitans innermongolicus]|uniref:Pyrrolo-quinoline quinone n=1 Tax=Natronolimnohabitans innermongolicus JCM 12255 TaxID=1227499 RepID=L9X368_9EURY|nr:PQQ-binding-like beta-propeller repeat protein [Natronolimnohabitans innermongolicus]ELY55921.1 pyrrolo-quinoline quinone [Natronolimnohabitans innermongolicus JCM 12255]
MTDWNQFKGDRRHSGVRRDLEGPDGVTERWTIDLAGPAGSPVLDRDTVFVGTTRGNLYALERETGRRHFTFETTAATATAPVVTRDRLYLGTDDGTVSALDPARGDRLWEATLPGALAGALTLDEDETRLYASHDGGVSALEATTGEFAWTHETDSAAVGAPAVDTVRDRDQAQPRGRTPTDEEALDLLSLEDARMEADENGGDGDRVYVGTADGTVRALAAETGDERWTAPISGSVVDGPTLVGDRLYVADDTGTLVALHTDSGQSWFTYEIQGSFTSSPTVLPDAGATFVGADDGYLHVTDTTFGRRKLRGWVFSKKGVELDGPVTSSPVVAGDVCCIGDETGSLYGVDVSDDAEDCDLHWFHDLEVGVTGTPALGETELFVGTEDDRLTCLEWDGDDLRS